MDCPIHPLCFRIDGEDSTTLIHAQHCAREDVERLVNDAVSQPTREPLPTDSQDFIDGFNAGFKRAQAIAKRIYKSQ